jgi:hypothetical protein
MLEDDIASKVSLVVDDDCRGDLQASNHVEMLVDQLAQGVADKKCSVSQK